jgi:integrase
MNAQYRYKFIMHAERSGSLSLRLRVTLHGERPLDYAVGCTVPSREDFDEARMRARASCAHANDINSSLSTLEAKLSEIMSHFEHVEKRQPTRQELLNALDVSTGRIAKRTKVEDFDDFYCVYDKFTHAVGVQNQWTRATYQKFDALKNHLTEFEPILKFSKLDEDTLQRFLTYMTATLKMRNTTVGKQLGFLRWFLRWASQHGYYSGTLHDTFRPKLKGSHFEQKEIIFLTLDELQTVENWVFSTDKAHLERARDVFVFCCYTGLRFSDAAKLKRDDVHDDYISVVTKKTSDRLRIELNRHSRAILDKYKDTELPNNRALPAISNQKTNDYLKDIGKECKIDEPVRDVYFIGNERIEEVFKKYEKMSTHCARRTFVCTALQLEVPSEVITRWTGHSDLKSMKPYIAIVDELKAKNMSKFDKI